MSRPISPRSTFSFETTCNSLVATAGNGGSFFNAHSALVIGGSDGSVFHAVLTSLSFRTAEVRRPGTNDVTGCRTGPLRAVDVHRMDRRFFPFGLEDRRGRPPFAGQKD